MVPKHFLLLRHEYISPSQLGTRNGLTSQKNEETTYNIIALVNMYDKEMNDSSEKI